MVLDVCVMVLLMLLFVSVFCVVFDVDLKLFKCVLLFFDDEMMSDVVCVLNFLCVYV